MRRWLARLSYTFLIIAALLLFEAYMGMTGRRIGVGVPWIVLCLVCAVVCLVAGAWGIRIRHAPIDDSVQRQIDQDELL